MKHYESISFFEFQRNYSTEDACREKLFKLRWPEGFTCPHCGNTTYYYHSVRHLYQCTECKYQVSVTAGTALHRTKIPLVKWFWAMYLITSDKRGISALELSKKLELRYETAWTMTHKIRKAMHDRDSHYDLLGVIEIDETFIGSPSEGVDKKGRGSEKIPVIVSVSTKDAKMLFAKMQVVESVNKEEIKKIVSTTIPKGETIKTDGLNVYKSLTNQGYKHERIIISGSDMNANELLKWVHIIASNAKSWINGTFHGIDRKHLQSYLDEFCYRLNRRFHENELLDRVITACANSNGITYAELYG
ncbi:MAG: IS1595 family transposase [Candidatus Stygibacter frigidus]|nr:IS1595 family transposase [Candidatus Stygibacter frigidus]